MPLENTIRKVIDNNTSISRLSTNNVDIAVTITFKLDNMTQTIVLDTVNDVSVNCSSNVTEHPIVNGTMVADHMFINPVTMSIAGSISIINANQNASIFNQEGSILSNIQHLFERLQKEGIMCDIVKLSSFNDNMSFLRRQNMVLTNIQWNESVDRLSFSFSFKQAITVEIEENEVDWSDEFLPALTEGNNMSFTQTLLDWTVVDQMVGQIMDDKELWQNKFKSYLGSLDEVALAGLVGGTVVGLKIVSTVAFFTALSVATGVGIVVVAAAAIVALVVGLAVKNALDKSASDKEFRENQFKYYENDRLRQQEVERFCNFIGGIHQNLTKLDNYLKVFQITSNEDQECLIAIGNTYYTFNFKHDNVNNVWTCNIYDVDYETCRASITNMNSTALQDFSACTPQNTLFNVPETGEYVYFISDGSNPNDLTTYNVVTSSINPQEVTKAIEDIIIESLTR